MKFIDITLSFLAVTVFILGFWGFSYQPKKALPQGNPLTQPDSARKPLIRRPILPLRPREEGLVKNEIEQPRFENRDSKSGEEPQVDFPEQEWIKNIGSKKDGAGMCVFSAFEMMMIWHGFEEFRGFRNWCAEHYPGGGYPDKLDQLVNAWCKEKNIAKPLIIQYVGDNPDFLETALNNGWMPCTTLAHSPRYGAAPISHMVNGVHLTAKSGAIMDNNFKDYEWWASREQCLAAIKYRDPNNGRQVYWAVAVVAPGPPPPPRSVR